MARSSEKLHSSRSSRAMRLFGQPPRSIPLWFLAKLSRNCLGICQECGKRCTRLQKHAVFAGKQFQDKTCLTNLGSAPRLTLRLEISERSNLLRSRCHYASEKRVNLGRFLLSFHCDFAEWPSLIPSFCFRQCRPGDNDPGRVLRRFGQTFQSRRKI